MTTLEKIRSKCIEVNPQIGREKWRCLTCNAQTFFGEENLHNIDCGNPKPSREIFAGRPIRLADVLLAMGGELSDKGVLVNTGGDMCFMGIENGFGVRNTNYPIVKWNLRKDSLEDQSPEVITFISSILGV